MPEPLSQEELKGRLSQEYSRERWLGIIKTVFPANSVTLFASPKPIAVQGDKAVSSFTQYGEIRLEDGKGLALLEVEVTESVNILRNRVNLRNRVAKFIDQDVVHGVLAVFNSKSPEYRFTFTAKETAFDEDGNLIEHETATKRFTYVLGPGETCTTAAQRFHQLSKKLERIGLDDVVEAFSVEKLNREFFNTYIEHYNRFVSHLLSGDIPARVFNIEAGASERERDKALKPVRDFVKRLMGRMVFLHFLQKKGWLGCPADSADWKNGDRDFVRNFFQSCPDKRRFHSRYLVPLFFEALNKQDRKNDIFPLTGTRIPYLNGGLFEHEELEIEQIDFPPEYFDSLLEFFAQYNFTIDENDPDEHEVGIDPEMLGHIFENLLEDNKDKGAYYTPKAIVHYMCQQSIIYYLLTHLGDSDENRAAIEFLVRTKQIGEGTPHADFIRVNAARIEDLLDRVKICDPAIGSGAFPIGLLQEIFWLKLTLDMTLNEPAQLADIKRTIIQNSIYGVDIDAGAVDIARLRFWLSLVVDEEEPHPLPNLDYKIMQGDSLLESFEGIPLDKLELDSSIVGMYRLGTTQGEFALASQGQHELSEASGKNPKAINLSAMLAEYFELTDLQQKQRLFKEIDQHVLEVIDYNIDAWRDERETELHQYETTIESSINPSRKQLLARDKLRDEVARCERQKERLHEMQHKAERPWFLWRLFFQDVYQNGGFDIVIANPPYVRQETIKDYKPLLKAEGYACYTGTADLFVYFYERSVRLLRKSGVLTYITSNKYYRSRYGEKLRTYLANKLSIREMIDFGDAPVFDAIAYASIIIGNHTKAEENHALKAWNWKRGDKINRIAEIMGQQAFPLKQSNLTPDSWRLEKPEIFALIDKIREKGIPLGKYVKGRFYYGIKTGLNEAFVVDRATRDRLITEHPSSQKILKPFLRGRDVKRWEATWAGYYLIKIESSENKKHPWSGLPEQEAEEVFKQTFPSIHNWFKDKRKALIKRYDQGKYYWELRSCAYWKEFEEPKIVYPELSHESRFSFQEDSYYTDCTTYIIPTQENHLTSILNSSTVFWYIYLSAAMNRGDALRFKNQYLYPIPIPPVGDADKRKLSELEKKAGQSTGKELATIEEEINQIVYRLFDLTPDEIALIERV